MKIKEGSFWTFAITDGVREPPQALFIVKSYDSALQYVTFRCVDVLENQEGKRFVEEESFPHKYTLLEFHAVYTHVSDDLYGFTLGVLPWKKVVLDQLWRKSLSSDCYNVARILPGIEVHMENRRNRMLTYPELSADGYIVSKGWRLVREADGTLIKR